MSDTKKLISWNVNGIRSVVQKGFAEWFLKTAPDVLCLQEIKATEAQVPASVLKPEGWHTLWHPAEKAGYSGTALFTKEIPENLQTGLGDPQFDTEGRTITAWFRHFILVNAYFPSGRRDLSRVPYKLAYNQAFLDHVNRLRSSDPRPVIFCGDVNIAHQPIDLARPKGNQKTSGFLPEERVWVDHFQNAGFRDTFRHLHPEKEGAYSWWSNLAGARGKNIGWRIDYFFVEERLLPQVQDAFIWPEVLGSDHCPIGIELAGI
ncbi:MAG: exodeoxyribonuclease III [Rhodothermia bacterium]|nr:exodeoxyribonuclease III [Rhodothermia bacterium]